MNTTPGDSSKTATTKCNKCSAMIEYDPEQFTMLGRAFTPCLCDRCEDRVKEDEAKALRRKKIKHQLDLLREACPKGKFSFHREDYPAQNVDSYNRCLQHDLVKRSLILSGASRTGKTVAACQAARRWVECGGAAEYLRDAGFGIRIEKAYAQGQAAHARLIARMCAASLLIVDDLGKSKMTARYESDIFAIIDYRLEKKKLPTIITTQHDKETLFRRFENSETGEAVIGRLRDYCKGIYFRKS